MDIKPILKGTLEEKLKQIKYIHAKIKTHEKRGIRESSTLDKLLYKRHELEIDIDRHLLNNEQLSDSLLDYCFRYFTGTSHNDGITGEIVYTENVFDKIPLVKEFTEQIKEFKGQKILSIYGDTPTQIGVISNECGFNVTKNHFRNIHIPVKELLQFNSEKKKWKHNKTNLFDIPSDIFKYPKTNFLNLNFPSKTLGNPENLKEFFSMKNLGEMWETDHSKQIYFGGPGPKETKVYIGDKFVENSLETYKEFTIPAQKGKIPVPNII